VSHDVLLHKLELYGCSNSAVTWCRSYLTDRYQTTMFKGCASGKQRVSVGVPQGSIIGPLMFILFMNDLPLATDGDLDMYADDTTMTAISDNVDELEETLNHQLEDVHKWCSNNQMVINTDKTKSMLITTAQKRAKLQPHQKELSLNIGGHPLKKVKSDKLLGVIIDEDLSWSDQIAKVLRCANAKLALLRRIKYFLPTWARKQFYGAYIQPHLDYCCTIWGCGSDIDKLTKFQKRAARTILNAEFNAPTEPLLKKLNWMTIKSRVEYKKAVLVFKSLHGLAPGYCRNLFSHVSDISKRTTRLSSDQMKLYINPKLKKCQVQRTIAVSGANIWNNLPKDITSAPSLNVFKTKYLKWHLSKQ